MAQAIEARRNARIVRAVRNAEPKRRHRGLTEFQHDVQEFMTDPQVKALNQARQSTFKLGESVESLTLLLKSRILFLKGKTVPAVIPQ